MSVREVDGVPIPATEAGTYFCHDIEFPHVSCFPTGAEAEGALADQVAFGGATALANFAADSAASYGGSYAHLSQNRDGLRVIGWNDRISSLRARNTARGSFHVDWYAGGARLEFCCNRATLYLSSTFNKTISSVYRG